MQEAEAARQREERERMKEAEAARQKEELLNFKRK